MILREFNKLEDYLKYNNIPYERFDERPVKIPTYLLDLYPLPMWDFHQICVPNRENCEWDVICHKGSYGYDRGLLEIMGSLITEEEAEEDNVVGWLTADDVIRRIEERGEK